MFIQPPSRNEKLLKYALVALTFVLVAAVVLAFFRLSNQSDYTIPSEVTEKDNHQASSVSGPERIDFGKGAPSIVLPEEIRIQDDSAEQNYHLRYPDRTQMTAEFLSPDSSEKNIAIYRDFFKKEDWNVTNEYSGDGIMSIYAEKGNAEINVTANKTSDSKGARLNVSVLYKQ